MTTGFYTLQSDISLSEWKMTALRSNWAEKVKKDLDVMEIANDMKKSKVTLKKR